MPLHLPSQISLIKKYGLLIQGFSGQHLLIDPNLQRKIVDLLDLKKGDQVLEIGPGLGALSYEILNRGASLVAVEKDPRFVEVLEKELLPSFPETFKVLKEDVLEFDWEQFFKTKRGMKQIKVVSNLPYYITAPILFTLIEYRKFFSVAVLMMQKEVAARILASPGSKDYGRLTIGVRLFADSAHAFDVSRTCFTPQPKVDSSVLVLSFHQAGQFPKGIDPDFVQELVKLAFSKRRKVLISIFQHSSLISKTRAELETIFSDCGIALTARAEELLIKDFLNLAVSLTRLPKSGKSYQNN